MLKTAANLQKENGSSKQRPILFYVKKTFLAQTPKTVQQPIWLLSKFVPSLSFFTHFILYLFVDSDFIINFAGKY